MDLAGRIRTSALRLGFVRVAFAPAERLGEAAQRLSDWLARGFGGEMEYLAAPPDRTDPRALLAGARTVVVCAMPYAAADAEPEGPPPHGRIARYARGADYHGLLKQRLRALAACVRDAAGTDVAWRACVDTAPLAERALAARAGLGFVAKNTMIITPGLGSYTLLGELLLGIELDAIGEPEPERCGRCTACLDVCPTGALVGGRMMDARLCISYLTIELDGPIPRELRPLCGDWIFGCDLCQEVCPFNAAAPPVDLVAPDLRPRPRQSRPALTWLLGLGAAQFRKYVDGTALRRVRRRQLLRNVCVALGNVGGPAEVPALVRALSDRAPLVRGHAAWALGRLGARAPLEHALSVESDGYVREEIAAALDEAAPAHYIPSR